MVEDLGHVQLGRKGHPLRILQLTDLHHFPLGTSTFEQKQKGKTVHFLNHHHHDDDDAASTTAQLQTPKPYSSEKDALLVDALLAEIKPDLVVLTGDIIDGRPYGNRKAEATAWKQGISEVIEPLVRRGVRWTFVPGNHDDDQSPWSREDLLGVFALPGCISAKATSFDHTLTVGPGADAGAAAAGAGAAAAAGADNDLEGGTVRLWLFDSGGNHLANPALRYYTFREEAVAGLLAATPAKVPCALGGELAFFHIPLPQCEGLSPSIGVNKLFDAALVSGAVPAPFGWEPFTTLVRLLGKDRVVGASKLESGMFDALVQRGVRACWFGHDHFSDACFVREGLVMGYGRVGGFTPPVDWERDGGDLPFSLGARVIESGAAGLRSWIASAPQNDAEEPVIRREERSALWVASEPTSSKNSKAAIQLLVQDAAANRLRKVVLMSLRLLSFVVVVLIMWAALVAN